MKRSLLVLVILFISLSAFAQPAGPSMEAGGLLTVGLIENPDVSAPSEFSILAQLLYILFSIRGGGYAAVTAPLDGTTAVGVEAAYMAMYLESADGSTNSAIMDLPLRLFGRIGFGPFAVQPFNGVNIGASFDTAGGFEIWGQYEIGARLYIGGFFAEFSQLLGNPQSDNIFHRGYARAGIGFRLVDSSGGS